MTLKIRFYSSGRGEEPQKHIKEITRELKSTDKKKGDAGKTNELRLESSSSNVRSN